VNPRAFTRIVVADLRGRRLLGTVLFVLVVAVSAAGIVTGLESRRSAAKVWDAAFERAQAPHAILHAADPAAFAEPVADPRVVASATAQEWDGELVRGADRVELVVRSPVAGESLAVGAPYLRDGKQASAPTEITFEESVADDLGIAIGEEVALVGPTGAPPTSRSSASCSTSRRLPAVIPGSPGRRRWYGPPGGDVHRGAVGCTTRLARVHADAPTGTASAHRCAGLARHGARRLSSPFSSGRSLPRSASSCSWRRASSSPAR
jgi:hypothetical protein